MKIIKVSYFRNMEQEVQLPIKKNTGFGTQQGGVRLGLVAGQSQRPAVSPGGAQQHLLMELRQYDEEMDKKLLKYAP